DPREGVGSRFRDESSRISWKTLSVAKSTPDPVTWCYNRPHGQAQEHPPVSAIQLAFADARDAGRRRRSGLRGAPGPHRTAAGGGHPRAGRRGEVRGIALELAAFH